MYYIILSSDEELRRLIDLREFAIMNEQNRLNGAKKEGKADLLIKLLIKKFKILPVEYRKNRGYVRRDYRGYRPDLRTVKRASYSSIFYYW